MQEANLRAVALWDAKVKWERRDDGSMLVWQADTLDPWPDRMSDRIAHWAKTTPDRTWMAERGSDGAWVHVSYGDMLRRIRSIGQVMLDLNLSADRPLIILSENSIAHALVALGAQYVGVPSAAIAPAYSLLSGGFEKLSSVKDQITPGAVFAEDADRFADAIHAVFPDQPRLGLSGAGITHVWADVLSTNPTSAVDRANRATGPETIAKFLFTSGTTGNPKAVITTQNMLCSNQQIIADCMRYFRDEPPVVLDWAPWNHVASGNKVFYMTIFNGGTFYVDAGKPTHEGIHQTIRNLREISPNWYFNVPIGYEILVHAMEQDTDLRDAFFRDLKLMMYAGAPMAEHTWAALDRLAVQSTGERVSLCTGLGATETAPEALFCAEPQPKPGNVGIPGRGVTLKLVPTEGKWEARLKSPSVTPGYWRDPTRTAQAFDAEGYYCLGDALRFADPSDPAKGFFFDGRVAENFKLSTGTWVAVGALRAKLTNALDGLVRDVVVAGEGRASLGALLIPLRPAAEKVVANGSDLDDATLFGHPGYQSALTDRLTAYNAKATGSSTRVPVALVLRDPLDLDNGEVTDKGSVNQRAVLRHRQADVEALYSDDARIIRSG